MADDPSGDREQLRKDLERTQLRLEQLERQVAVRHELEADLRRSIEWFRAVFDYAPDAYYLNDIKGQFVDGNLAAERLTGFLKEELIGQSFLRLKLLPPDQIPVAAKLLARSIVRRPTGPDELTLVRKDGTRVPVEVRTFPVTLEGRPLVLGIARDISDRKKGLPSLSSMDDGPELAEKLEEMQSAIDRLQEIIEASDRSEEDLLATETYYQAVLHSAPAGVVLLDPGKLSIIEGNEEVQRWLGLEHDQLQDMPLGDLFVDAAALALDIGQLISIGRGDLGVVGLRMGDGTILDVRGTAAMVSTLREPVLCVVLRKLLESE